jgi:predicted 3-demethylubiquinone-9 3-methyltransferase (glyoxalase superfamily)
MPDITTFLTFENQAEQAVQYYLSIFEGGKVLQTMRVGDAGPGPKGSVLGLTFELLGQKFMALNGGPTFKFTQAISLFVSCDTQAEIDRYWTKLTENGGKEVQCGWLVDKFGVSWQIAPRNLTAQISDPDPAKASRAMQAMMQMTKFDIAALKRAYDGVETTPGGR